jgi:hypothetical protein
MEENNVRGGCETMTYIIDNTEYAKKHCGVCGVIHFMPQVLEDECRMEGSKKAWTCPSGHERVYRDSDADKLRRERDLMKQQLAQKDDEIASRKREKEQEERQAAAAKGQVTRLKNRAKAGMCPCCNRHFVNLERHMNTKHPDEKADA